MLWSFMAIVINTAYTGKVVSNLLIPEHHQIVNSLQQLSLSSLRWIVRSGTSWEQLFMVAVVSLFSSQSLSGVCYHQGKLFCELKN